MKSFDSAIKAARSLIDPTNPNPEYERGIAELIANTYHIEGIEDGDNKREFVFAAITHKRVGPGTIQSLSLPAELGGDEITISLTGLDTQPWAVYIPATCEDMFEGYDPEIVQPEDEEPWTYEANIIAPWGTTYWDTLQAAIAFLSLVQKQGNVKFNDGRSAE